MLAAELILSSKAKAKTERDEALAGVASRGDISGGSNLGLRRSQTASSDMQTVRAEL